MDFKDFTQIPFPDRPNIVYVLGLEIENAFLPFYVGESSRNVGRLGDYVSAQFTASTDFNVGQAVKAIAAKGHRVVVRYKTIDSRDEARNVQNGYVEQLRSDGANLLNGQLGYDYRKEAAKERKQLIDAFVDDFLRNSGVKSSNRNS